MMIRNRIPLVLTALLAAASASQAKPTLQIIPQRVVFTSLLQHVDVRVQLPASDPAFSGYVSVTDTSNFSKLSRFGVAISMQPGEDRVVRIPLPGPQYNPPSYHAELSASRDLTTPLAYVHSKFNESAFIQGPTILVLGGAPAERQVIAKKLRSVQIPLNINGYNGVTTYENKATGTTVVKTGAMMPDSMVGEGKGTKVRVVVPRSNTDVNDWSSINFGRSIAVVVLRGGATADTVKALQVYADFGGVIVDADELSLRNAHGTVISVNNFADAVRVVSNIDDISKRFVAAQNGHSFISSTISDREMLNAPELKSPSTALIFVLLGLYTLVAIPVLYFVLKRSGKRELAWVALPGLAVGFTGIFGIIGAMNRPSSPFAQHRELIAGTLNSPNVRSFETFSVYNGVQRKVLLDVPSHGDSTFSNESGSIRAGDRVSGYLNVPQWSMASINVESPTFDMQGSVDVRKLASGDLKVTNNTPFILSGASLGRTLGNNVTVAATMKPGQSAVVSRREFNGPGSPGVPSFDVGWGFTLNQQIENGFSDQTAVLSGSDYYFKARIMDVPSSIKLDGKPLNIVRSQRMLFLRCEETGILK